MNWVAADDIEKNMIVEFQTSYSNTLGYYIFRWTGYKNILQEQYTCHSFDPPFIIPEGELVCPTKFMTPMIKTSYWYHKQNKAISVMLKLKQVGMPLIELIKDNNTTNKLPLRYK